MARHCAWLAPDLDPEAATDLTSARRFIGLTRKFVDDCDKSRRFSFRRSANLKPTYEELHGKLGRLTERLMSATRSGAPRQQQPKWREEQARHEQDAAAVAAQLAEQQRQHETIVQGLSELSDRLTDGAVRG